MNPRELPGAHNPEPGMNDRPRVMLTLRCTRACPYCTLVTGEGVNPFLYREMTADKWIDRFLALHDQGLGNPILSGREPLLYKEFVELVNSLPDEISPLVCYTNLEPRVDLDALDPNKVNFAVTLHRGAIPAYTMFWMQRVKKLKERKFNVKLDCLGVSEENLVILRDSGLAIPIVQKPWVDLPVSPDYPVMCHYTVRWFGPDGRRWHCTAKMLAGEMKYIRSSDTDLEPLACPVPTCTACDWWFIKDLEQIK